MKIAILSFYSEKYYRGVETWARNLKKHLSGIQIFSGWQSYNPLLWIKADIVVPANGRFQVLLARLFCKKIVVFGHSGPGADDKWNLWCSPNIFVAFSSPQAAWANKFKLPWTKIIVIPHAVDTKIFQPVNQKVIKNTVLCVASNDPNKRINLVARAVALLPGVELVAVGQGNPVQADWKDIPKIYQQAKVFCFVPWEREAFGLVFLEALASNLPVVTIDDPIRREIVGEAGVFVKNPENISDLAKAIKLALQTDWKDKPRRQAEKFSWDIIAHQYSDLCKSLARH